MTEIVKFKNFKELSEALKSLPDGAEKNVLRNALNSGAKQIAETAKTSNLFKDRSGTLRKSIRVSRARNSKVNISSFAVAGAPHAHLIEFGFAHKSGKTVPGTHFMENAFNQHKESIVDFIESEIFRYVQKKLSKIK